MSLHATGQINPLTVDDVRADFLQVLETKVHGKPLVYLDNAASTLKPKSVVQTVSDYYQYQSANIHRGVHTLSEKGTLAYENVRKQVAGFINAKEDREVIYTKGTTDSINLVAKTYGRAFLKKGDEVLISTLEHHSNIVPWQMLCEEVGCVLKVIPVSDQGEINMADLDLLLSEKTKLVSVVHVSNTLGTINDVKTIIQKAHAVNAVVLVDGAQAIAHEKVDVQDLDCDFYAFSAHKIYGPTGVGVLYGKAHLLEAMPPFEGGGDMIDVVTFEKTTYNDIPFKFEAGTPHIAGVIGLGAALGYVEQIGFEWIQIHEMELLAYATEKLEKIEGLKILGPQSNKASVISFIVEGVHPSDLGTLIDHEGVAIRTGHHCTQPLLQRLGVTSTSRASFSIYNTKKEIDIFVAALIKVLEMLR